MAGRKVKSKDIKKQRWASIVAAILAVGMLLSLMGAFIGSLIGGAIDQPQAVPAQQEQSQDPEEILERYQAEVDRLEAYLEEYEPSAAVLLELAQAYQYLISVRQVLSGEPDLIEADQMRLAGVYERLIELDPDSPYYRLELVYLYGMLEKQDLLDQEVVFLEQYFSEIVENETAEALDHYYYAVLLGEFMGEPDAAKEQIQAVLEQEDDESILYQEALGYLEYLEASAVAEEDEEDEEMAEEDEAEETLSD